MFLQHYVGGLDRHQPARQHQQINGLHSQTLQVRRGRMRSIIGSAAPDR
jgi:hypothetical protein